MHVKIVTIGRHRPVAGDRGRRTVIDIGVDRMHGLRRAQHRREPARCIGSHQLGRFTAQRVAHQPFEQAGRQVARRRFGTPGQGMRHHALEIGARAGISTQHRTIDAQILERHEQPTHHGGGFPQREEPVEVWRLRRRARDIGRPRNILLRGAFGRQLRQARTRFVERERERSGLVVPELMQHGDPVQAEVVARHGEFGHRLRQVDGQAVGGHAIGTELALERGDRAQMQIAPGQPLRKQREHTLCVDQVHATGRFALRRFAHRRVAHGSSTSTISATAPWTPASSVTARAIATSHARRGAMPPTTSCAV